MKIATMCCRIPLSRFGKGLREFRYEAKLFTWMYRVATNEAINFLSEKRRKTLWKLAGDYSHVGKSVGK